MATAMLRKEPPVQEGCAAEGCANAAAIIHGGKPLCGRHALEQLERETAPRKATSLKGQSVGQP